ncbi:MAG: hypothetical protein ABI969_06010 [bacterium]
MRFLTTTALLSFACNPIVLAGAHAQSVAVLEHPQCAGDSVLAVHPLFTKTQDGWIALRSADVSKGVGLRDVTWTVALDGRSPGHVRTIDIWFYGDE